VSQPAAAEQAAALEPAATVQAAASDPPTPVVTSESAPTKAVKFPDVWWPGREESSRRGQTRGKLDNALETLVHRPAAEDEAGRLRTSTADFFRCKFSAHERSSSMTESQLADPSRWNAQVWSRLVGCTAAGLSSMALRKWSGARTLVRKEQTPNGEHVVAALTFIVGDDPTKLPDRARLAHVIALATAKRRQSDGTEQRDERDAWPLIEALRCIVRSIGVTTILTLVPNGRAVKFSEQLGFEKRFAKDQDAATHRDNVSLPWDGLVVGLPTDEVERQKKIEDDDAYSDDSDEDDNDDYDDDDDDNGDGGSVGGGGSGPIRLVKMDFWAMNGKKVARKLEGRQDDRLMRFMARNPGARAGNCKRGAGGRGSKADIDAVRADAIAYRKKSKKTPQQMEIERQIEEADRRHDLACVEQDERSDLT
jgi:hypothetical protein